jgi:hypothetical protein
LCFVTNINLTVTRKSLPSECHALSKIGLYHVDSIICISLSESDIPAPGRRRCSKYVIPWCTQSTNFFRNWMSTHWKDRNYDLILLALS